MSGREVLEQIRNLKSIVNDQKNLLLGLQQENEQWKTWGVIEIVRNPNVSSYMDHWEKRATTAEARIEAALALHTEWGIYDECGHDHAEEDVAAGRALEIEAVGLVCEEGRIQSVCRHCHLLNDEPHEDTDRGEWPCPTHKALTGEG